MIIQTKLSSDGALYELTCHESYHETLHIKRVNFFEWTVTIGQHKATTLKLTSASPIVPTFTAHQSQR